MNKPRVTAETLRARVCHGWAFRVHTGDQVQAIKHYLETGDVTDHFPYKNLHQALVVEKGHIW